MSRFVYSSPLPSPPPSSSDGGGLGVSRSERDHGFLVIVAVDEWVSDVVVMK
jgi:hypothetical protein